MACLTRDGMSISCGNASLVAAKALSIQRSVQPTSGTRRAKKEYTFVSDS